MIAMFAALISRVHCLLTTSIVITAFPRTDLPRLRQLVRRVLRQSLVLAAGKDRSWAGGISDCMLDVYRAAFARAEDKSTLPLGLQLHLIEILLEEVAKVTRGAMTSQQLSRLIEPFLQVSCWSVGRRWW